MTTAYMTALSDAFQERLVPGVRDISIRNDPIFQNVIDTSASVNKDPISNDWRIYYSYTSSLAGGLQFSSVMDHDMVLDGTDRANIVDSLPSFPGLQDSAIPTVGRYSIGFTSVRGNIYLPFTALQANAMEAAMNDMPALVMRKHIDHVAHLMACSWYADANGGLAQLNSSGNISATSSGNKVTVTASAGNNLITDGRIRRLKPGMYVDLYDSTYSTKLNANGFALIVGAINHQNGAVSITIYFDNAADVATYANTANSGDSWIAPREGLSSTATSSSRLPCGYQTFVISSGTLYGNFGDLTITNVPELASVTASAVGDLSETVLNKYLSLFQDGVDGDIDAFFTSGGVILDLLDQPLGNNWYNYDRQGEPLRVRLGWDGIDYTYDGKKYTLYQSPYITKGHFLGLKVGGGNIQRHYPPRMQGLGRSPGAQPEAHPAIQWIGPMFHNSIWMPTLSGTRVTEGMQAPYLFNTQMSAKDPRGILLTGCTDNSIGA